MPSGSYSFQMMEGDVISKLEICLSEGEVQRLLLKVFSDGRSQYGVLCNTRSSMM